MSSRRWRAPCAVALASILATGSLLAGCADEGGALAWDRPPRIIRPPTLPDDRILTGRLRNDGLRPIELRAGEVRLLDGAGRPVGAQPIFLAAFSRGLYPPTRRPDPLPEPEQRRTGLVARIEPRQSAPITVAWRERSPGHSPRTLAYGEGSLPVP